MSNWLSKMLVRHKDLNKDIFGAQQDVSKSMDGRLSQRKRGSGETKKLYKSFAGVV